MRSLRDVNQRVVGIVSAGVIAASCLFAFAVGQLHLFEGGYEVSGVFKETGGLRDGEDVRVAGVKVGRVKSIKPDFGQGNVIVTWTVDGDVDLGRGTRADVQTSTLLGGRYLKLSGPVSKPYLADVPVDARRITLSRTSVPYTVTDVVEGGSELSGALDQKAVDRVLVEAAKIDTPDSKRLGRMLRDFREVSSTLNDNYPEIQQLITNSKKVTGTLAAKDQQLIKIVNSSKVLLESLAKRRDELAATIGKGNRTVQTLSSLITKNKRDIDRLLKDLHLLTTRLAPNMDVLNTDLALLGPTFQQAAGARGNGPWLELMLTGIGPVQLPNPISNPPERR